MQTQTRQIPKVSPGLAKSGATFEPSPRDDFEEPADDDSDVPEIPCTDDADWDVFLADDDRDPLPEPGDFWIDAPDD